MRRTKNRTKSKQPNSPLKRKLHMPDGVWSWEVRKSSSIGGRVFIQPPDNLSRHSLDTCTFLRIDPNSWERIWWKKNTYAAQVAPGMVREFISDGSFRELIEKDLKLKQYPSIPGRSRAPIGEKCTVFKKYDGSNLRFEYNHKKGWYKFGTRRHLFDKTDRAFGEAIELFQKTLGADLAAVFNQHFRGHKSFMVFAEYLGPNSFAGKHLLSDPKELVIIDIVIGKTGFLDPADFLKYFGHLNVAEVVYEGLLTEELINDVDKGKYPVEEGVVCKGGTRHTLWRCKIKTQAYRERLKQTYKEGWERFWE